MKLYLIQKILNETSPDQCCGKIWAFVSPISRANKMEELILENGSEQYGEYVGYFENDIQIEDPINLPFDIKN